MRSFLKKPHPFIFNWSSLFIPFIITLLVLFVFKPFGFSEYGIQELILWSLIFGTIASFCVWLVVKGMKFFFRSFTNEETWTVGKAILLYFIVIHFIAITVFVIFWLQTKMGIWNLFQIVYLRTILISLIPVVILVLYEQFHHQKLKAKEAMQLNELLMQTSIKDTEKEIQDNKDQRVVIKGDNEKAAFQIEKNNIIYVKSEANYVEVFYMINGEIKKELVRNSLKSIELQLNDDFFFRSHKSYLINLNHILKAEGNARSLSIIIAPSNIKIPVSRSCSKELLERIKNN
jgi:hypothetical protein